MFKHPGQKVGVIGAVVIAAAFVFVSTDFIHAAGDKGVVAGVVTDSAGQPVSGAFVKLKNADRRLTFMVVSQAKGRFEATELPTGKYAVEAVGNELQSDWSAPVEVSTGRTATVNVSLSAKRAAALPPAWPGRPPGIDGDEIISEGTAPVLPEGEGKRIVENRCTTCHNTVRIVGNRVDREHWQATVDQMRENMQTLPVEKRMTEQEAKVVLDYLAAQFPPMPTPDPNSRLPRNLLQGKETQYVAVEYEMANHDAEPHDVTVDLNGDGWANERTGGNLAHLDPTTFSFEEVALPRGESQKLRLGAITRGPNGMIWFVDGGANNSLWSFDPATRAFTRYPAPKLPKGTISGNTMRVDATNQTVWETAIASNTIVRLDVATKKVTYFSVPEGVKRGANATPYGMAISRDGKVWFAENSFDLIGRVDPETGKFDEFNIPVKNAVPRRMGADADGNIWVGLHGAGKLLKVDYATGEMTPYTPPTANAGTYSVSVDLRHNLVWVSEQQADKIARFDPKTGEWLEFPLPNAESDSRRIEIDPNNPNRVWWSGNIPARIGYIELLGESPSASTSRSGN